MTLKEELVLFHYKHYLKTQLPAQAMLSARADASRAMSNYREEVVLHEKFKKPVRIEDLSASPKTSTQEEREEALENWTLANMWEIRTRTEAKEAVSAYMKVIASIAVNRRMGRHG